MFKWTTLVCAGLACCLTLTAVNAGPDMGCLPPPPPQDYLKKTVRVEIKGTLVHLVKLSQVPMKFPGPSSEIVEVWQITVGGKTYMLDLGPTLQYAKDRAQPLIALPPWMELQGQAGQLVGKTVIVTGTLDGTTVHVTGLKAGDEYVKETTEVEARGQLNAVLLRCGPGSKAWNLVVDGKTYGIAFASSDLEKLAETLDGKDVVLNGVVDGTSIAVSTLKAAE